MRLRGPVFLRTMTCLPLKPMTELLPRLALTLKDFDESDPWRWIVSGLSKVGTPPLLE